MIHYRVNLARDTDARVRHIHANFSFLFLVFEDKWSETEPRAYPAVGIHQILQEHLLCTTKIIDLFTQVSEKASNSITVAL